MVQHGCVSSRQGLKSGPGPDGRVRAGRQGAAAAHRRAAQVAGGNNMRGPAATVAVTLGEGRGGGGARKENENGKRAIKKNMRGSKTVTRARGEPPPLSPLHLVDCPSSSALFETPPHRLSRPSRNLASSPFLGDPSLPDSPSASFLFSPLILLTPLPRHSPLSFPSPFLLALSLHLKNLSSPSSL